MDGRRWTNRIILQEGKIAWVGKNIRKKLLVLETFIGAFKSVEGFQVISIFLFVDSFFASRCGETSQILQSNSQRVQESHWLKMTAFLRKKLANGSYEQNFLIDRNFVKYIEYIEIIEIKSNFETLETLIFLKIRSHFLSLDEIFFRKTLNSQWWITLSFYSITLNRLKNS